MKIWYNIRVKINDNILSVKGVCFELKILEITNNLNIAIKDIDEYLDQNELGLVFQVLCVSIERDRIKISQKDYEIINTLGIQMDNNLWIWINLKNNVIK